MKDFIKAALDDCFSRSKMIDAYTGYNVCDNNLTIYFNHFSVQIDFVSDMRYYTTTFKDHTGEIFYRSMNDFYNRFNNKIVVSPVNLPENITIFISEFTSMRKFNTIYLFNYFKKLKEMECENVNSLIDSFAFMSTDESIDNLFEDMAIM